MKFENSSLVNAFPLYFVKIFFETIFKSEASSARHVSGLKVLVPLDKFFMSYVQHEYFFFSIAQSMVVYICNYFFVILSYIILNIYYY